MRARVWPVAVLLVALAAECNAGGLRAPDAGYAGASLVRPAPRAEAASVPDDEFWSDGFALPDVDGWVNCAVVDKGSIVIGGRFTMVGGVPARNVARWDGAGWSTLGEGVDGDVLSLASFGGGVVASGRFDHSGLQALRGIARWNGSAWAPLGAGLWLGSLTPSSGASALAVRGGALYAAGAFDHAGGGLAKGIARWDGAAWSPLGSGLDDEANALCFVGDSLYVGGAFENAGGVGAQGVALWDGTQWADVGGGVTGATSLGTVYAMTAFHGRLVVAGAFDLAGGQAAHDVAAWDGHAWAALGTQAASPFSYGSVHALGAIGDTLYAGASGLFTWDGSAWTTPGPWLSGRVNALLPTGAGLLAGGQFIAYTQASIVGMSVGLVSGGQWHDLTPWNDRMHGLGGGGFAEVTSLASYHGDVVASGWFLYAGEAWGRVSLGSMLRWSDATRTWYPLGAVPGWAAQVLLAGGDTLWAGGAFGSPATTNGYCPVARFDGTSWSLLDTLSLYATSLSFFHDTLYAAGRRLSLSDPNLGGVYRWAGGRWERVGELNTSSEFPGVAALLEFEGRLVAAGTFDSIGGIAASGVAAWNGSTWSAMGEGSPGGAASALGTCDGVLYAGGDFDTPTGGYSGVARWDGKRWVGLPSLPMHVNAFGSVDHRLFAAGFVADAQNVVRGVMGWDGRSWASLGSGLNDGVDAVLVQDGDVWFGGRFTQAGGRSSSAIARWRAHAAGDASALLAAGSGIPNPFSASTSVAYRLAAPGRVHAAVFDVHGRRVVVLDEGTRSEGTHVIAWDGHDEAGHAAPLGIYFVRLELPGRIETRRVVHVH